MRSDRIRAATSRSSNYDAFHNFGWIYLNDFGLSEEEVKKVFEIVSCQTPTIKKVLPIVKSKTYFEPWEMK
jgi:hypothetical protein